MKTKNKMIALVEIAIVLCSVFLAALPAIATQEQNQGMQKISASEVTTASEDDYVLGIYGNANEDGTIDMGDVVYTKLAIFGKKPKTELCDAKYDGRINVLDVIQTKLIILGKEKEITFVDTVDRVVTVKKPIERVILFTHIQQLEAIGLLGVQDKVVNGISGIYFPELSKLPKVDRKDYEGILNLKPDLVIVYPSLAGVMLYAEKLPGVTVIGAPVSPYDHITPFREGMMKLGYMFDKEDEAKHYINEFYDKYIDLIKGRTEGLSEEERPKVYEEMYSRPYRVHPGLVEMVGGRDIFGDLSTSIDIDPETVIAKNPDIIIKKMRPSDVGYATDDLSKAIAYREEVLNRPELANVNAVKNGRVYVIYGRFCYGLSYPIAIAYYAKWFHPELFEDLDPQAIHQEYLELLRFDYDLDKHGVFVYPPFED